jgi:hypothetical protein
MCALLSVEIQKENPAARSVQHICGKVKSSKPRRPNVSIAHTAGQAKTKLIRPNPKEARSASMLDAPASWKIVEE